MNNMERIGWWFLRHSKPQRTYFLICPNCGTLNPSSVKKCTSCKMKIIYKTNLEEDNMLPYVNKRLLNEKNKK